MRTFLVSLAILALCGAAFAADDASGRPPRGEGHALVNPKTDPVLTRLALTEDQIKAIDKLVEDAKAKVAEILKAEPKPRGKELAEKVKPIKEELLKAIRAVLTAEQQTKFDAGQVLVKDFETKRAAAAEERAKAVKDAGDDKDKAKEAGKAFMEKLAALKAELEKALDEKVGKVPAPPASTNPPPAPKTEEPK